MDTHTHGSLDAGAIIEIGDDLLADLDMSPEVETADDLIAALDASDENAIEIAASIAESHSEAIVSTAGVEAVEAAVTSPAKEKKARAPRAAAAPKVPKDLASLPDEVFDLVGGLGCNKADVIALRPHQKKIGEKFDNLFQAVSAGKKPSTYVMACFDVLDTKGEATSSDLVAALKASSSRKGVAYDDGTARSQVGQVMVLFNIVGVATRTGQTLALNRASPMTVKLKALAVAA